MRMWYVAALLLCAFITTNNTLGNYIFYNDIVFSFSSQMRRYCFYVNFNFPNLHKISTFGDFLSEKKQFLHPSLSVVIVIVI